MFTVKIPYHLTHMSKDLYDLQTKGELCDLHLTSSTSSLDLHKVILAGMSDLALARVRAGSTPDGKCSLHVPDSGSAALLAVVKCLYLGELEFDKEIAKDILVIADDLGISRLASFLRTHPIMNDTKRTRARKRKASESEPVKKNPTEMTETEKKQSELVRTNKESEIKEARKRNKTQTEKPQVTETVPLPARRTRGRPRKVPLVLEKEPKEEPKGKQTLGNNQMKDELKCPIKNNQQCFNLVFFAYNISSK